MHESPAQSNAKVLVVDDEVLPRRAVARWLGGLGLHVVTVGTAAEALALMALQHFDVVVADWLLAPPERGDQLLSEIRARYPNVRRVLFSGQPIDDPSCAHFYIAKPASVDALQHAVHFPTRPGVADDIDTDAAAADSDSDSESEEEDGNGYLN